MGCAQGDTERGSSPNGKDLPASPLSLPCRGRREGLPHGVVVSRVPAHVSPRCSLASLGRELISRTLPLSWFFKRIFKFFPLPGLCYLISPQWFEIVLPLK